MQPSRQVSYLVVRNQHESLWKPELDSAVRGGHDLARNTFVAADSNDGRSPNIRHNGGRDRKRVFRHGHVRIIPFAIHEVERRSDQLCDMDAREDILVSNFTRATLAG